MFAFSLEDEEIQFRDEELLHFGSFEAIPANLELEEDRKEHGLSTDSCSVEFMQRVAKGEL